MKIVDDSPPDLPDAVGHVESVNPAAELLFGWLETELVGRPIAVVVPGLELSGDRDGLDDLHWGPSERMMEATRKDGERLPGVRSLQA